MGLERVAGAILSFRYQEFKIYEACQPYGLGVLH